MSKLKDLCSLKDNVCIITGGARGLGRHFAFRLAEEGCNIAICDINEDDLFKTKDEIESKFGKEILAVKTDITREAEVQNLVNSTQKKFGKIDHLVANAAISFSGSIHDIELDDWDRMIDINLNAYFLCVREVTRVMISQNKGSIVQINSRTGKRGSSKNSAYAASKGGGIVLTQSLSQELGPHNIRINSICPGSILESDLWEKELFNDYTKRYNLTKEELIEKYLQDIPLGRACTYEDVSNVALFLLSDQSSYMTGQAINVTGGLVVW